MGELLDAWEFSRQIPVVSLKSRRIKLRVSGDRHCTDVIAEAFRDVTICVTHTTIDLGRCAIHQRCSVLTCRQASSVSRRRVANKSPHHSHAWWRHKYVMKALIIRCCCDWVRNDNFRKVSSFEFHTFIRPECYQFTMTSLFTPTARLVQFLGLHSLS